MRHILSSSTRHIILLSFEVAAALFAIILLAWGGLLLRLDQGPINITALSSTLEQTLNSNIEDYDISFKNVQLGWGGLRTPIELQLTDVGVFDKETGTILAGISQVGLEVSKKAMLMGEIAPSAINFYNIGLRVFYDDENGISLTLNHADTQAQNTNVLQILEQGMDIHPDEKTDLDKTSKLRFLQTVRIIDADVLIQSRNFSEDVVLKDTRIVMKKNDDQITATLDGMMHISENETPLLGHIYFNPNAKTNIASLHFSDLQIKDVKSLISEDWRKRLTLEGDFKGTSHISFDSEFQPQNVRFEINVSDGRFNFDDVFSAPVSFENLGMVSAFDFETQEMTFDDVRISNDELEVILSGQSKILKEENKRQIELKSELKNLPVNDIQDYWPKSVLPEARNWVSQNIKNGLVTSARQDLKIIGTVDGNSQNIKIEKLDGEIHFEKAEVTYLHDFPRVENVSGTALFDPERFVINIDGGLYNETKVLPSQITIDGFDDHPQIDIGLSLETNFADALDILDHEPYKFTSKMNLPHQNISGDANVQLNFKFPLHKDLTADEVNYSAKATSKNLVWRNIFKNKTLANGSIDLNVDAQQLNVSGGGVLSDLPINFDYVENFKHPSLKNVLNVETVLPVSDFIQTNQNDLIKATGSVTAKINGRTYVSGAREYDVTTNLQSMLLDVPAINIVKLNGVPGQARFKLNFQDDNLKSIQNIDFDTPVLSFSGDVEMQSDDKSNWKKAILQNVKFNQNNLDVTAENKADEITLDIRGSQFDLIPFFKNNKNQKSGSAQKSFGKTIEISGKIDQLITSQQGAIQSAKLYYKGQPSGQIQQLELDGIAGAGEIYLRYKPNDQGQQTLRLEADDAGSTFKVLGYSKSIRGGVLVIDGRPGTSGHPRDMAGRFQLSNFTVYDAPVLARLLNGLSVTGLSALLQGEGINFARLAGDFKWQDKQSRAASGGLLKIIGGKTAGASLGLTFDGDVDMADDTIDIKGNLVPVSKLNTAFSEIPVLGDILTGGGDGIFAATYSVKGKIKNPETTVNPLAALAPGVLRDIFFEQDFSK